MCAATDHPTGDFTRLGLQSRPTMPTFHLQFDPHEISTLAAQYSYADDSAVREAGIRINGGDYSVSNLLTIVKWKSPRSAGRVLKNSADEIADALRLALDAATERSAISVLTGLHGVDIPVASAILTAIAPDRFTIIDYRALEALGVKRAWHSVGFYLDYLGYCRDLASTNGVDLRTLDRALWQWSKMQPVTTTDR